MNFLRSECLSGKAIRIPFASWFVLIAIRSPGQNLKNATNAKQ
jgi:hypothetical protein